MLQTPSPVYDAESPTKESTSNNKLQPAGQLTTRRLSAPEVNNRIRIDVYVSVRNHGDKVDEHKMPKTCVTQFALNRSPHAYLNRDFYTSTVAAAKVNLATAAPFYELGRLKGPWMPKIEFKNPMFKFTKTENTCFLLKSYPTEHDLLLMPEPYRYASEPTEYQKMFIIFECGFPTKFQLQPIKTEPADAKIQSIAQGGLYDGPIKNLLAKAEQAISLMDQDTNQARLEWISALINYREGIKHIMLDNMRHIQPQPYVQALPDSDHAPTVTSGFVTTVQDTVRPNFTVQIKPSGDREVQHPPDTTGTPAPLATSVKPEEQVKPVLVQRLTESPIAQMPTQLVTMTPDLFYNIMLQQQLLQQPSVYQRLGPMTPPIPSTPSPTPPTPPPRRSSNHTTRHQRRRKAEKLHHQGPPRDWHPPAKVSHPRWTPEPYYPHEYRREGENRSPGTPPPDSYRNQSQRRDPRINRYPREEKRTYRDRSYHEEPRRHHDDRPQRVPDRPAKRPKIDEPKPSKPTPDDNVDQFKDYAKILNIAPEKMQEAYRVMKQALGEK